MAIKFKSGRISCGIPLYRWGNPGECFNEKGYTTGLAEL
jgi:hypothetical protein